MPNYRESFVFRLETDVPAMLWNGHGDLELPADDVLPEPTLCLGGAGLVDFPDFEQLINGQSQTVEITLSGVTPTSLEFAAEEAEQVPGAAAYVGRIRFDDQWQLDGPVVWEWTGEGKSLGVIRQNREAEATRSIVLRLSSGDPTRSRAALAFFTDADQKKDFPTDRAFENVAKLNTGTSRRWGPAS